MLESLRKTVDLAQNSLSALDELSAEANKGITLVSRPLEIPQTAYNSMHELTILKKKCGLSQQHPDIKFKMGHCTILGKRPSNEDAHVFEHFEHAG